MLCMYFFASVIILHLICPQTHNLDFSSPPVPPLPCQKEYIYTQKDSKASSGVHARPGTLTLLTCLGLTAAVVLADPRTSFTSSTNTISPSLATVFHVCEEHIRIGPIAFTDYVLFGLQWT